MGKLRELLEKGEAVAVPAAPAPPAPAQLPKRSLRERVASGEALVAPALPGMGLGAPVPTVADLNAPAPSIGPGRAAAVGFSQGASMGFADEAGALATSARQRNRPMLGPTMRPSPDDTPEQRRIKEEAGRQELAGAGIGGYKDMRNRLRREAAQAEEVQPRAYGGGELLGAAITAGLPMGAGSTPVRALAEGAVMGGLTGAGDSTAEALDGDAVGVMRDVGKGMAGGAVAGGAGYVLGREAPRLLRRARSGLEKVAIGQGRRVLLNGADSLSSRLTSDDAVREALESKAIVPFGTTKGAAQRLEALTEEQGKVYNEIIDTLEKNGVQGPRAKELAAEILAARRALRPGELNEGVLAEYEATAEKILDRGGVKPKAAGGHSHGAPKPAEPELVDQFGRAIPKAPAKLPDKRLGLKQAEDIKRSLQRDAKYGRVEETALNEARRDIASMVREANEQAIEEAAAARGGFVAEVAEDFKPVKRRLGNLLEAERAAQRGAQKAENRASGMMPSTLDVVAAGATGNPAAMATTPVRTLLRNRGASTVARGAYGASKAAGALARRLQALPQRGTVGAGAATALERALDLSPSAPMETEEDRKLRLLLDALRGP